MRKLQHIHNQAILRGVLGLKTYIEERAVEVTKFMIYTNAVVLETAKKFKMWMRVIINER